MHRITSIKTYFYFASWRNITLVKVETEDGLYGIGEATIRNKEKAVKEAVEHHIAPFLVGESVFSIEKLFNTFFSRDPWRNGAVFNTAISGIETAMWDLMGKYANQPVYNLLGGQFHKKVKVYANGWFKNNSSIDEYMESARRITDRGFKAIKWDPLRTETSGQPERKTVEKALVCVQSIRKELGDDIDLLIELHGSLSFDGARDFIQGVVDDKPLFIEEPVHPDDLHAYRKLQYTSLVPLAAGERSFTRWQYKNILEEGYLSVVQPDMTHMGGMYETKKVAAMAETNFLKVAPHNSSGPVATMAVAHLDSTLPNFLIQEMSEDVMTMAESYISSKFPLEDGYLVLGDAPGLGMDIDFAYLEKNGKYKQSFTF